MYRVRIERTYPTDLKAEPTVHVEYRGPYSTLASARVQASRLTSQAGWYRSNVYANVEYARTEWESVE